MDNGDDVFRVHGPGETLVWNGVDFDNFLEPMPVFPPEMEADLTRVVRTTVERGWPFRYHASCDQSIERFLGVMETINRDLPVGGVRWILDHAETISARNIDRVAALGGVIAVQHQMAFQGDIFREHYGEVTPSRAVAHRSARCCARGSTSVWVPTRPASPATTPGSGCGGW